jgi:hypothetical protein
VSPATARRMAAPVAPETALQPLKVGLPLGIGDVHWVCTKLRALSGLHGGRPIHAYVNRSPDHRSTGYLDLVPFIERAFQSDRALHMLHDLPAHYKDRRWSTLEGSRRWREFDYMLIANGHLENGLALSDWLPELETEYSYPLAIPDAERAYARSLAPAGSVLLYPSGVSANKGFHRNTWTVRHWGKVVALLNRAGVVPVLVGAKSKNDLQYRDQLLPALRGAEYIDTIGQTNIPQVLAMIEDAGVWCGLNSGLGIVSAMRYVPTVMLWADARYPIRGSSTFTMHPAMQRSWLAPDQLATYRTLSYGSPAMTPDDVVEHILDVRRAA